MKDYVGAAELIVVGELVDREERAFSITFKYPEQGFHISKAFWHKVKDSETRYFDRAKILNPKVLKGSIESRHLIWVAFDSKDLGHYYTPYRNHKTGEAGIWFLTRDHAMTSYWFPEWSLRRENPIPAAREEEIEQLIHDVAGKK